MSNRQVYYSPLYRDFHSIESNNYQRMIRFYEDKEKQIGKLDFGEYFDLTVRYVDALFETGAYRKHLLLVDGIIEASIEYNVRYVGSKDVFRHMLFRKAASCYRLGKYDQAHYILHELLRIQPEDQESLEFLKKTIRQQQEGLHQLSRAGAIFFFMCAAMVTGFEVLFVRPFYESHADAVEWARNALFLAGVLVYVGVQLYIYLKAHHKANQFRDHLRHQGK